MASSAAPRVRRSLIDVQRDYDAGNKTELENLVRAWKAIKELPPEDKRSFFTLGGFHGEPFRGPGATDPAWWGGYCQHGTVLFPTWHRAYLHALEEALRSIDGCHDVTLPFWDECSPDCLKNGIPRALTDRYFELDGVTIDNPLRSFVFPVDVVDDVKGDNSIYTKAKGYETVRYPLSGLVGTDADRAVTSAHNAKFPSYDANVLMLNANIVSWLSWPIVLPQDPGKAPRTFGLVRTKFQQCLDAPTYTLFSNTTSMSAYNGTNPPPAVPVVALESPHNAIHLAVGGFDVPGYHASPIQGANGDMGENNTAGLDPIFFFHHCFIDYTFWTWQKKHGAIDSLDIDETDPGARYLVQPGANNQPPADADPNAPMTMDTPLNPFVKADGSTYSSADCVNIESQLGYTYGPGSLDQYAGDAGLKALASVDGESPGRTVHVAGLNRGRIAGSFVIAAYADVDGVKHLVDVEPVLARWSSEGCANCQNHLEASADFRVPEEMAGKIEVRVHTRGGVIGGDDRPEESAGFVKSVAAVADIPFTVEIR